MVSPPNVNHGIDILALLIMICEVGAEIGPTAIGFFNRPILVVAKLGRPEERKCDGFPIFDLFAFGLFQFTVVDQAARA